MDVLSERVFQSQIHGLKKSEIVDDPYFRDYFKPYIPESTGKDDITDDDLQQFKDGAKYLKRNG